MAHVDGAVKQMPSDLLVVADGKEYLHYDKWVRRRGENENWYRPEYNYIADIELHRPAYTCIAQ